MENTVNEVFISQLQEALRHLYNPVELRQSAMVPLLGLEKRPNPSLALQELIITAIEELRPADYVPTQSDSWRVYQILTYRHIEQSSQPAVAVTLALSVRQLRRLERMAEQALAEHLWKRHRIESRMRHPSTNVPATPPASSASDEMPDVDEELAWLKDSFPSESGDIASIIHSVEDTIAPLIRERDILFHWEIPENVPPVSGQVVALRQGLLNLLTAAMHATPSGSMSLRVTWERTEIRIDVEISGGARGSWSIGSSADDRLQMARRFINLFGGSLELTSRQADHSFFGATVRLPADELEPVLVIDDNADTLRLIQRYLTASRYRFYGARNPDEALSLAEEISPAAIVLDVMLPGIDDWELLGRFRAHPDLREVPIIVFTILPQEELALALGAAAYLRKPISREALRRALDQQVFPPSTGSS